MPHPRAGAAARRSTLAGDVVLSQQRVVLTGALTPDSAMLQAGAFQDAVEMVRWMRFCKVAKVGYPFLSPNGAMLPAGQEDGIHITRVPLNYRSEGGELPAPG